MCNLVSEAGSRGGLQEGGQSREKDLLLDIGTACDAVCLYSTTICSF